MPLTIAEIKCPYCRLYTRVDLDSSKAGPTYVRRFTCNPWQYSGDMGAGCGFTIKFQYGGSDDKISLRFPEKEDLKKALHVCKRNRHNPFYNTKEKTPVPHPYPSWYKPEGIMHTVNKG